MTPFKAPQERSLGTMLVIAVALSYLIDGCLLAGFAAVGAVAVTVPLLYVAAGMLDSAVFLALRIRAVRNRENEGEFNFPQVIVASSIQLIFAALAPQLAFYFFTVLFVVFGCSSLSLTKRESVAALVVVAVSTALLMWTLDDKVWVPQETSAEQLLVWLCFIATLGRCVALGVLGRTLRMRLQDRRRRLRDSIQLLEQRDKSLEDANRELQRRATHDALTGIANRALFTDNLQEAVDARRPFAVCVFDLDRFKLINDSLGHGAGDALLKQVSQRLLEIILPGDLVARAGGDEFLVLIRDVQGKNQVDTLLGRWMQALSQPYQLTGIELHVSPSIGVARYPTDGAGTEELLARADEAMYHAKRSGRHTFRFFDPSIMGFSRGRLEIEGEIRQALKLDQLALHYQPKVDVVSGEVRSVEALIRWHHPTRGKILPGEFIPIAEESGLILEIGDWVIQEACRQAGIWQSQKMPFMRIAVNVSPLQLRQGNFVEKIRAALREHSLDPTYLEIELTEATLMSNAQTSVALLNELSELGVIVAIDDFGTGYSSMSYLQRFPVDKLKIDRSFINELAVNPDDASIVRAIISLAHGLRLKVIAEGVESEAQLRILRRMGCDQYQGFFRSEAVPAGEIERVSRLGRTRIQGATDLERTQSRLLRLREA